MIELTDVAKVYRGKRGEIRALDLVSFAVQPGEMVIVRGPSGSGKTTLLLTIGGMIRPTSGQVTIDGTDIYRLPNRDRERLRAETIGFVFQMFHLLPYLSALDNVRLPAGLIAERERPAAAELLERVGLAERLDHTPAELSTGERQRMAVARALINQPRIVLADEPTGNLDPDNGRRVIEHLAGFRRDGGTVVVVTHEPWVEEYADRVLLMNAGRLEPRES